MSSLSAGTMKNGSLFFLTFHGRVGCFERFSSEGGWIVVIKWKVESGKDKEITLRGKLNSAIDLYGFVIKDIT